MIRVTAIRNCSQFTSLNSIYSRQTGHPLPVKEGFPMKNLKHLPSMLTIVFVVVCFNVSALGQSSDDKNFAAISSTGSGVRFDVAAPHAAVTLTVAAPDGQTFTKEFKSGNSPEFRLIEAKGER